MTLIKLLVPLKPSIYSTIYKYGRIMFCVDCTMIIVCLVVSEVAGSTEAKYGVGGGRRGGAVGAVAPQNIRRGGIAPMIARSHDSRHAKPSLLDTVYSQSVVATAARYSVTIVQAN